jgi:hypothetical protein
MNWVDLLDQWKLTTTNFEGDDDYHAEIIIVTAGDSWTWGDSLDSGSRLNQIYGKLIADKFNADWINVGCRGWSNSYIIDNVSYIVNLLTNSSYKKIIVVLTLTENGRDIKTPHSFPYNYIECFKQLGATETFYNQLLTDIEMHWAKQILELQKKLDQRYTVFLGYNFVWNKLLTEKLSNTSIILAESNWIEVLADYQNLPRPIRTNLVCGWIFKFIDSVHEILARPTTTAFKSWALPLIDQANLVNQWLDNSPMNGKKASKHPNAEGHAVWANYILKRLSND